MNTVPLVCRACGRKAVSQLEALATANIRCLCGSTDVDVDDADDGRKEAFMFDMPMGIVNNDPYAPMDLLSDTQAVAEVAKCSSCFHQWKHTSINPGDPLGPCPNCGSMATSVAGATNTGAVASKTALTIGEMEDRSYEATCPNPDCEYQGAAFVHDDLSSSNENDDEIAECPECGTPLVWDGRTASKKSAKAQVIAWGILATNTGMSHEDAWKLALRTVERYPNVVKG